MLSRPSLRSIYNLFARSYLDFGDMIYDQACNNWFHCGLKKIQYNAALVKKGDTRGTTKEKNYQGSGFEILQQVK